MGREVKGDLAIDFKILHKIIDHLKDELFDQNTTQEQRRWIANVGAFYTVCFTLALRGNEISMLDLMELGNNLEAGRNDDIPHVVVPLLGRFKGEDFGRHHCLLAPEKSNSGF